MMGRLTPPPSLLFHMEQEDCLKVEEKRKGIKQERK
jgi:hypothetical protein